MDVNKVINICEIGTSFCLHRGKVMSWHFKNALKGIKGYFYSENFIQKLVLLNTTSKIPGVSNHRRKSAMSGNNGLWDGDREISVAFDSMLELEHEKLQNSLLEKSFFGSSSPRNETTDQCVALVVAITRDSLPPGSDILQRVMQEIRHSSYKS